MVKHKQIESLRREIEKEKEKIRSQKLVVENVTEKKRLERELLMLRNPRKFAFGQKALMVLRSGGRKIGRGIIKQARLIKEQQERESKRINPIIKIIKRKKIKKGMKKRKSSSFSIMENLPF